MSLTLEELKEEVIREYDVVLLCEVLDITPEDILFSAVVGGLRLSPGLVKSIIYK